MVVYSIELSGLAIDDIGETLDWYRDQKEGLEKEFVMYLEAAFEQIVKNPLAFEAKIKQSRNVLLQRFPYKVVFKIYGSKIKIIGVIHHSRSPKFIRKRFK